MGRILLKNGADWSPVNETKSGSINLATIANIFDGTATANEWQSYSSYNEASRKALIENVVAGRCISYIAGAVAQMKWIVRDSSGNVVDKHPVLDLLKRPNPAQGTSAFFHKLQTHKLLHSAYVRVTYSIEDNTPIRLQLLQPDHVMILEGDEEWPLAYQYNNGRVQGYYEVNQETGQSVIIPLKHDHPLQKHESLSYTEQASRAIQLHQSYQTFNKKLLDNGATITNMIMVRDELNEDGKQELRKQFERQYNGSANAGKNIFSTGDIDVKPLGQTNKEMAFMEGFIQSASDIALAYNISPQLVGIQTASTFNNYSHAKMEAIETAILPEARYILDEFNATLMQAFPDHELDVDLNAISALQSKRESKIKQLTDLKGILTTDEIRSELGYQPLPEEEKPEIVEDTPVDTAEPRTVVEDPVLDEPIIDENKTAEVEAEAEATPIPEDIDTALQEELKMQNDIDQFFMNIQESKFQNADKKNREFEFKAVDVELDTLTDTGIFRGYAAVFNNIDSHSDIIQPNAFTRSLQSIESSGREIPIFYNHASSHVLGQYISMQEDSYGLLVEGKFNLQDPKAKQVYNELKSGRITGLSIGYVTIMGLRDPESNIRVLKEVKLNEISVVNVPSNMLSRVMEVKKHKEI